MNKKQVIRINESQLKQIVTESVKRVLNEGLFDLFRKKKETNKPNPSHQTTKEVHTF